MKGFNSIIRIVVQEYWSKPNFALLKFVVNLKINQRIGRSSSLSKVSSKT
jgi:hypothetical protein